MFESITPGNLVTAVIAAILGDLLLRGLWRFIDMTPDEKEQSATNIKTAFMISFPVGLIALATAFIVPKTVKALSFLFSGIAAFGIMIAIAMFFDLLKRIRQLENKIEKLTNEKTNKNAYN